MKMSNVKLIPMEAEEGWKLGVPCSRSQQEGRYKIRLPMHTLSMDGWGRSESGPTASLWQRGEERGQQRGDRRGWKC
jgi:uncharacterized protein involved in high-affinity Fe2+ transport